MLLLYSKGCEHALQALTQISLEQKISGFSVRSVCRAAKVPESFTRKVFQNLVKSGILAARRGPGGGYRFRKDPTQVSVLDIIYAVDGKDAFEKCVIKDFRCDKKNFCPLHPMWMKARENMIGELKKSSVSGLVRKNKIKKEARR